MQYHLANRIAMLQTGLQACQPSPLRTRTSCLSVESLPYCNHLQSHRIISTASNPTWIKHTGHAYKHSSESIDTALAVSDHVRVLASSRFQHDLCRSPRKNYCQERAQSCRSFTLFPLCIHMRFDFIIYSKGWYTYTIVHQVSCLSQALSLKTASLKESGSSSSLRKRLAGKGWNPCACHILCRQYVSDHVRSIKQVGTAVVKCESEQQSTSKCPSFSHSIAKSKVFDESVGLPWIVSNCLVLLSSLYSYLDISTKSIDFPCVQNVFQHVLIGCCSCCYAVNLWLEDRRTAKFPDLALDIQHCLHCGRLYSFIYIHHTYMITMTIFQRTSPVPSDACSKLKPCLLTFQISGARHVMLVKKSLQLICIWRLDTSRCTHLRLDMEALTRCGCCKGDQQKHKLMTICIHWHVSYFSCWDMNSICFVLQALIDSRQTVHGQVSVLRPGDLLRFPKW